MQSFRYILFLLITIVLTGCNDEKPNEPDKKLDTNFENRTYLLSVPENYDVNNPSPLIFAFHGFSFNANDTQRLTDLDELGKSERYIVVYPNSIEDKGYWTDGCGCYGLEEQGVDDIGYVDYLLNKIMKQYSIDTSRVYALGISQGASFVQHLACKRSEIFAAFSSYIGSMRELLAKTCSPQKPVNMIIMNGTLDLDARWNGLTNSSFAFLAIPDLFKKWAGFNGCTDSLSTVNLPDKVIQIDVERIRYEECSSNKELVLYKILRGEHLLYRNPEFDFSVETINFFSKHKLDE